MEYILLCKCDVCKKTVKIEGDIETPSEIAEQWSMALNYTVVQNKGIYLCNACYFLLELLHSKHNAEILSFSKNKLSNLRIKQAILMSKCGTCRNFRFKQRPDRTGFGSNWYCKLKKTFLDNTSGCNKHDEYFSIEKYSNKEKEKNES